MSAITSYTQGTVGIYIIKDATVKRVISYFTLGMRDFPMKSLL